MVCGIYKITNLVDNKVYIGSSVNHEKRKYKHFWMLNKNIHDNDHLQNSYNKHGSENFIFEVLETCNESDLNEIENLYIKQYNSCNSECGYNMGMVNEFRRNTYNDEVKIKLSKHNMLKNKNFSKFSLKCIENDEEHIFESLVEATNFLLKNGYSNGKPRNVRLTLSNCLRGIKLNNGKGNNGSIRKTCYKHKFKIIN